MHENKTLLTNRKDPKAIFIMSSYFGKSHPLDL